MYVIFSYVFQCLKNKYKGVKHSNENAKIIKHARTLQRERESLHSRWCVFQG